MKRPHADVVKLVDTLDLGSSAARRVGSSPSIRTKMTRGFWESPFLFQNHMNIVRENVDDLNAVVKIKLSPEDYQEKVDARLRDLRKTANLPGFRKGHVPMGMIKKMAGTGTLVEEINKILSNSINDYINENKLNILGNPLPKDSEENSIDWERQKDFEFEFELGLAPEFDSTVLSKVKVEKYQINVDEKLLNDQINDLARRYGKMSESTTITEDDFVNGKFEEVDKSGEPIEGGIVNPSSWLVSNIENKKVKKAILGLPVGESFTMKYDQFDSDDEKARLLGKAKEELIFNKSSFKFTVEKINHIEAAEINQELFDKIFGPGIVKSESEFRDKVSSDLSMQFDNTSDQKLLFDIQEKIIEKSKIALPDEFLKRWLMNANEKPLTIEQIDSEYDQYSKGLKWQIIENKLIRENDLQVPQEDAENYTIGLLKQQFAQYGQQSPEDEQLRETAKSLLQNQEEAKRIYDQLYDKKIMEYFKENLKIKDKKISYDDFLKLARK